MTESPWADMRETHIGVVFLVGDRAYKMKKPVTTAFLDFSTPERRLAACRREVELNRRLAPDVYLGVSGVSGAELPPWTGRGADGAPVEHLVVMRRMPDDRRLSTLVRAGAPVQDHLRDLARSVAAFHAAARRGPDVTAEGQPRRARRPVGGEHRAGTGAAQPCRRRRRSTRWTGWPPGSWPAAVRCSPTGAPTGGSSTATAT